MHKDKKKIGFIGMGLMGVPMSKRLSDAGFDVSVWNRSAKPITSHDNTSINRLCDLKEIFSSCDVIMICVSDTAAVEDVITGTHKGIDYLSEGQVIIDFSSISPDTTKQLAKKVAEKNVDWIDAPVSGGVAGAEAGSLAIMAGGSETVVNEMRVYLEPLSQRVTYMGPTGSGQVTKIGNQMLVSCNVLVMAEVLALAKRSGVDVEKIPEALKGGFADSIPLQLTGSRMASEDFDEVKWHVRTLLKDLDLANALAKNLDSSIPMAGLGAEIMRLHSGRGYRDKDPSTLIKLYSDKS